MEKEKEVLETTVSNFIEQEIDKDLAEVFTITYRPVSHRSRTDIFILDMQSQFF